MDNGKVVVFMLLAWGIISVGLIFLFGKLRRRKWRVITKRCIKRNRHIVGAVLIGTLIVPIVAYISKFSINGLSNDPSQWGQMGDFFGGMLNPIFAFASFMALLYTIRIQSEELRMTREELSKSASAAQKSAELEEINLSQQELNINRQFEFARYKEIMGLAREKTLFINKTIFDNYTELEDDGSGGEDSLRQRHVPSIKNWFDYKFNQAINKNQRPCSLKLIQSVFIDKWSGFSYRKTRLNSVKRELVLLGRLLIPLELISPEDADFIRSDVQSAIGILLCCKVLLFRDPMLFALNKETNCPFQGFLDAYAITLDLAPD